MDATNPYCEALGIHVPRLEVAKESRDANTYSLLIVALLERGGPLTLLEAARRFEEAGVAPAERALASLKRCKPGRPPIYREGDLYALDPHDDETDLWAFRLGLRPPKAVALRVVRPEPAPLPLPDQPLSVANLEEAWRDGVPGGWSALRIAICVLDSLGPALHADDVMAFVKAHSRWRQLASESASHWRRGAAIRVRGDGLWELDRGHDAVRSARRAISERIAMSRRSAHLRPDPVIIEANQKRIQRERLEHGRQLARMRRVLVHAFPAMQPEAVVLLNVGRREMTCFVGAEMVQAKERLAEYDIIAAVGARALLRRLGIDPGVRRIGELGPPQKTIQLNRRGRTLRITTSLLIQGSCAISRPFGDERTLRAYLRDGERAKLCRRLEADVKSLFALYQYGRLHGQVRLRWGFLDEMIPAPWVHSDESTIYDLLKQARALGAPLEVVTGSAPGWADPWSRARVVQVREAEDAWLPYLVDAQGQVLSLRDIQLARLAVPEGQEA